MPLSNDRVNQLKSYVLQHLSFFKINCLEFGVSPSELDFDLFARQVVLREPDVLELSEDERESVTDEVLDSLSNLFQIQIALFENAIQTDVDAEANQLVETEQNTSRRTIKLL